MGRRKHKGKNLTRSNLPLPSQPANIHPLFRTQTVVASMEAYSGPIPSPEALRQYQEIHPDLPRIWIERWIAQSDHRMNLESENLRTSSRRADWGVIAAFIITMTLTLTGGFLVYKGHDIGGSLLSISGLAGLAGTFIYGTNMRKEERLQRAELMSGKQRTKK